MRVLVYTDGSQDAEDAALLLQKMGTFNDAEVTILGVSEDPSVEESAERIEHQLEQGASDVKRLIRSGEPAQQLVDEAKRGHYELVIVAREYHHRHTPRIRSRSTTARLARNIPSHLLIARNVPDRLDKILICSGAERPSAETVRLAGVLTGLSGADIGLLHVMSQVALRADSPSEDLEENAEQAIDRKTHEGEHLLEAIALLREDGITTEIEPMIRHGLVVDEVLAEIERGGYDLLVLGSHHQPTMTRWMDVLLNDVTDELLAKSPISTLVIYQRPADEDAAAD
ncbi:MAG: universal stress protein [Anaerolineales bacterium]